MSTAPSNASFYFSGINHCELRPGQQLTLDHLRGLQQQLAENAGRARALQQQLQQQAQQQGIRAAVQASIDVKEESRVKKEEDGPQQQPPQQQLQYAALLALQLQQQQAARAAAAAAQAQQQQHGPGAQAQTAHQQQRPQGAPAGAAAFGAGPSALAHNVFPSKGPGANRMGNMAGGGAVAAGPRPGGGPGRKPRGAVEEPATDQWVQCSKCSQWRQVPDEFWPDIANADEDEDWRCKDALWDVEDYEPNTAACC